MGRRFPESSVPISTEGVWPRDASSSMEHPVSQVWSPGQGTKTSAQARAEAPGVPRSHPLCTRSLGPLAAPLTTPHPRGSRMHLLGDNIHPQNLGSFSHLGSVYVVTLLMPGEPGQRRGSVPFPPLLQLYPPGLAVCYHCDKGHDPKQLGEERLTSASYRPGRHKGSSGQELKAETDAETSRACCLLADTPGPPAQGQPTHNRLGPPMSNINSENATHTSLMKTFSRPVGHFLG